MTEQELEIMKIVWGRDQATVRDVYEAMLERRKVAYTTVMTMMRILEGKGYLTKSVSEKAHVYVASEPKERVMSGMVSDRSSGRLPQVTTASTALPNLRDSTMARLISGERNDTNDAARPWMA